MIEGHVPYARDNFADAFRDMYRWAMNTPDLSLQILETAIWINVNGEPIYIYEAKERAYEEGILDVGGTLIVD